MRKYGESKTTRIMMAAVPHVTSGSGLRKFQADGFLLDRVYIACLVMCIELKSSTVIMIFRQFVSPQIRSLFSCAEFMDEI